MRLSRRKNPNDGPLAPNVFEEAVQSLPGRCLSRPYFGSIIDHLLKVGDDLIERPIERKGPTTDRCKLRLHGNDGALELKMHIRKLGVLGHQVDDLGIQVLTKREQQQLSSVDLKSIGEGDRPIDRQFKPPGLNGLKRLLAVEASVQCDLPGQLLVAQFGDTLLDEGRKARFSASIHRLSRIMLSASRL
jgi:hypothetical protein